MYCAFCMPPFFSMPCLFICTSEYRIVYAMSFPSTWKWFWKCQSCLLYSVITCLLFDFIISSASGKILGEAKHLSRACQLMICSEEKKKPQFANQSAICRMHKVNDCSLLRDLPTVFRVSLEIQAMCQVKVYAVMSYLWVGWQHWTFLVQLIITFHTESLASAA